QPIEGTRRYDEHGPAALLLMALGRIERDQVDITALHYRSSLPTGGASSHSRSSCVGSAEASHWASSSSSVYRRRGCGSTINRPLSTTRATVAPARKCSMSRTAGGTASITEPPTLRRLVVCNGCLLDYIYI